MVRNTKLAIVMGLCGMTSLLAAPLALAEQGDWKIRGGVTFVDPKSENLVVPGFDEGSGTPAKPAPGSLVLDVDTGTSLGFNVTYMMTDNVGVELLAAWPFKHDVKARVQDVANLGKIAETKHLPPTLSLQYYFMPDAKFQPYLGAGINWTLFSSEKLDPALGSKISLDDSFGPALQIGADLYVNDLWFVNFDVRWIDIDTDAKITDITTFKVGTIKIDPMVYSIMLGRKF